MWNNAFFRVLSPAERGAVYEVKLAAFNGNGESDCSKRLVSLAEDGTSAKTSGGECESLLWGLDSRES